MKKVAFIVSHLGSGSYDFIEILNKNPRCNFFNSSVQYAHPDDIRWMFNFEKLKNYSGSVFGDHLLYNVSFQCKIFYKFCKFIYLIRPPRQVFSEIPATQKSIDYYRFRLRRICEMAKNTPDAVFLTHDDLYKTETCSIIESYLGLKEKLEVKPSRNIQIESKMNENLMSKIEDCYERYYYYMNNLKLKRV
jgi:hypothetical protein